MLSVRMSSIPTLSLKVTIILDKMLNFDGPFNELFGSICEQSFI